MYKLLALDLDGTLLNTHNNISDLTKLRIKQAQEKGVKILLISGRPYVSICHIASELELDKCFVVALSGCDIRHFPSGKCIFHANILPEQIYALKEISEKADCYLQIFDLDGCYYYEKTTEYSRMYADYFNYDGQEVSFRNHNLENICKAMYIMEPQELLCKETQIKALLPDGLRAEPIWSNMIDVYSNAVNKGTALEFVASKNDIASSEIIACGDEVVDLPMLHAAGLGVAMQNAVDSVKKAADVVTSSNDEDGVAEIIVKYILS